MGYVRAGSAVERAADKTDQPGCARGWYALKPAGFVCDGAEGITTNLDDAAVVVGMSTTVLEEAVLLGRPAVQLVHPEWLRYVEMEGVGGATVVAHDRLDAAALETAARKPTDANAMRVRLGLGRPLVDQRRLLAEDEETRA